MTIIESTTIMLALMYICSQLFWSGHKYGALISLSGLVFAIIIAQYPPLFFDMLMAAVILLAVRFARPQLFTNQLRINPLRHWVQHSLALSLLISVILYIYYHWQLSQGHLPPDWLRPNILDAFLAVTAGIEIRAYLTYGYQDHHHPAALVMFSVVMLTGLICKRAFCGWACPFGLAGQYLHKLKLNYFGNRYAMPKWLDTPLRSIKYLLLAFSFYLVFALPSEMLLSYFSGDYHQIADLKMLYNLLNPNALMLMGFALILLSAFWVRQGFCRYLCPYGALLGILSFASPLKIRRDPQQCLKILEGVSCGKCSKACPAQIKVDRLITVRSDECQACFRCIAACPRKEAIGFRLKTGHRLSHRGLVKLLFSLLFALPLLAYLCGYWVSTTPASERLELLPYLGEIKLFSN